MRPMNLNTLIALCAIGAYASSLPVSAQAPGQQPVPITADTHVAPADTDFAEETIDVLPELGLPSGGLDRLSHLVVIPKKEQIDREPVGEAMGVKPAPVLDGLRDGLKDQAPVLETAPGAAREVIRHGVQSVDDTLNSLVRPKP